MTPVVSVVIPCYNHGQYLDEALQSVRTATGPLHVETLIVNDGSTDPFTIEKLLSVEAQGYTVIHQDNKGLSAARNTGIRKANASIIVPLDSDNRLQPNSLQQWIHAFEAHPDAAVIYGDRQLFDHQTDCVTVGDFNLQKLMLGNYIDACAAFRKEVWNVTGGYDERMRTGWEDWEFWLHAAFKGFRFLYQPQIRFDYRVHTDSMVHALNRDKLKLDAILAYMEEKHPHHFGIRFVDAYVRSKFEQSYMGALGKMTLKLFFPDSFNTLVQKGKLRRYW